MQYVCDERDSRRHQQSAATCSLEQKQANQAEFFGSRKKIFVKSTQRSQVFISSLVSIKIFFLSLSYKYIQQVKKNQGYLGIEHLPNIKDNEELKILNLLSVESKIREIFSVFGFQVQKFCPKLFWVGEFWVLESQRFNFFFMNKATLRRPLGILFQPANYFLVRYLKRRSLRASLYIRLGLDRTLVYTYMCTKQLF